MKTLTAVRSKRDIRLSDAAARVDGPSRSEQEIEEATAKVVDQISALQRVLYASGKKALLIVLQGRDASGKDGTIRKVFSAVNPQGCSVSSFKAPTEYELRQDFLWRVHQQVPARGMIGIFNRSHYEDILVPRVHQLAPKKEWFARYEQINDFERMLSENDVVLLKFMLHISRDEQKRRLVDRLTDAQKNWKFNANDLDDRAKWDDFTKAYRGILANTSTDWAPWYVVPADDKDVRNLLIARTIADAMEEMELEYPVASASVKRMKIV